MWCHATRQNNLRWKHSKHISILQNSQKQTKQNKTKLTIVIICHRVILFPKGTPKPQTSKRVGLGAKKKKTLEETLNRIRISRKIP
jgi:hypothetical protein